MISWKQQIRLKWTQLVLLWVVLPVGAAIGGMVLFGFAQAQHVWPADVDPLVRLLWLGTSLLLGLLTAMTIALKLRVTALEATQHLLAREAKGKLDEHRRLRQVIDSLTVFVGLLKANGEFVEANTAALDAAGLKMSDVAGLRLEDTFWCSWHPEVRERFRQATERGIRGETSRFDVEVRMAGETRLLIDFLLVPLRDESGKVVAMVPSGVDITERERVRRAAEASDREMKRLVASVPGAVYQYRRLADGSGSFTFVSPGIEELIGISAEHLLADPRLFFNLLDADLKDEYRRCAERANERVETFEFDFRFTLAGGQKLYLHLQSIPETQTDATGARLWTGVMVDITELKVAQQALLESQRRFELAIGGTREGVWEVNYVDGVFFFSDQFKQMLGMEGRAIPDRLQFYQQFIHPDDHARVAADVRAHLEAQIPYDSEFRLKTPRGYRWFRSRGMAERDSKGVPIRFAGSMADIDDGKRLEQELRDSLAEQQRLLGREHTLLRELNHRVRNNLAGLLGLVNLYQRSGRSSMELGQAIREKIFALRQVHDLIAQAAGLPVSIARLTASLADAVLPAETRAALVASGPAVGLPASQSSALAMVLQELLTNSVKHGALARSGGGVRFCWSVLQPPHAQHHEVDRAGFGAEEMTIELVWQEWGMPGLAVPTARGTGLGLIEGLARSELLGDAVFAFEPGGMRCVLRIATAEADIPVALPASPAPPATDAGPWAYTAPSSGPESGAPVERTQSQRF